MFYRCFYFFFFSSRRRHTRYIGDWSSDVCSSDLEGDRAAGGAVGVRGLVDTIGIGGAGGGAERAAERGIGDAGACESDKGDRKSTRLNSSHRCISYAVFCLKKKKKNNKKSRRRKT